MSDPNQEFHAPPPPPLAATSAPAGETMSTPATLTGIFFEPSRTFEALRARPRFLVAGLILLFLTIMLVVAINQRVDMGEYIRQKMERSSQGQQQSEEQKEMGVRIGRIMGYVAPPVAVPVIIAGGAALYLLGVMAFGGSITYKQSLSVWAYSSLPPAVLVTVVGLLVLFLKAPETIDPEHLLVTNPGAFMNAEQSPFLTALLSHFDMLSFYGLFLAAIGLRKIAKLSSGSSWAIVIGYWLIGVILGVSMKVIFG